MLTAEQLQSDALAYFRGIAEERGRNYGFTPDLSKVSATYKEDAGGSPTLGGAAARAFSGTLNIWDTHGKVITLNSEVLISDCGTSTTQPSSSHNRWSRATERCGSNWTRFAIPSGATGRVRYTMALASAPYPVFSTMGRWDDSTTFDSTTFDSTMFDSTMLNEGAGLQFGHRLPQLLLRIHHNRSVPCDRLLDRLTRH